MQGTRASIRLCLSLLSLFFPSFPFQVPGRPVRPSTIARNFISQVVLLVKNPPASAGEVRDSGSIPGSGRSPGGRHGHPLQYSWASLVAQMVKALPAMWETGVRPLGREGPLEKGVTTLSSILAWRIPWTEEPGGLQSRGSQSWTQLINNIFIHLSSPLRELLLRPQKNDQVHCPRL